MNLLKETKKICRENNIIPARSRGQNFLVNEKIHDDIIKFADLKKNDVVLEVGPGIGFLTEKIAKFSKKVIAVEIDKKLSKILDKELDDKNINNVDIVNEDILKPISYEELPMIKKITRSGYKVVANLPYNITSIFFRKILSARYKPDSMVIMIQKEVAERIVAQPPNMSMLAISIQFYSKPKIVENVKRENFWPMPKIDSTILKLNIRNKFDPDKARKNDQKSINEENFFEMVKTGFSSKRKMLKNNLSRVNNFPAKKIEDALISIGFDKKARAQELSIEDWLKLFTILYK